jgi:hypothetical protein
VKPTDLVDVRLAVGLSGSPSRSLDGFDERSRHCARGCLFIELKYVRFDRPSEGCLISNIQVKKLKNQAENLRVFAQWSEASG